MNHRFLLAFLFFGSACASTPNAATAQTELRSAEVKLCADIATVRGLEKTFGVLPAPGTPRALLENTEDDLCAKVVVPDAGK